MSETESLVEITEQTVGVLLAQARERLNLSVDDVAARLRIAPRQVVAIEANDFTKLPGATIIRGFLRNYARLVQLDPDSIVEKFRVHQQEPDGPISVPHQNIQFSEYATHRANRALIAAAGVILVAAIGLMAAWRWEKELSSVAQRWKLATPAPTTAGSAAGVDMSVPHRTPASTPPAVETNSLPSTESVGTSATVAGATTHDPAAQPTPPTAAPPAADAPPPLAPGEAQVVLEFVKDAWVQVRDANGAIIYVKTNRAGTKQTISGPLPLAFTIGNAQQVRMTYNSAPFDLTPHIEQSTAKFRLEAPVASVPEHP